MSEKLNEYVASLNWAMEQYWVANGYRHEMPVIAVDPNAKPGTKYVRVVQMEGGKARSLHSWVERSTGKIARGAWAAPAKSTGKATKGQLLSNYDLETAIPDIASRPSRWVFGSPYYSSGGGTE